MRVLKIKNLVSLPKIIFRRVTDGAIDELVEDFEVPKQVLKDLGLTKEEAYFFHCYNPAHLYCALKDIGMNKTQAKLLVMSYKKNIYLGIEKFIGLKKQQQDSNIEERTICLHQAFIRNRPGEDGYGDCSVCLPDVTNNPTCRGYYPFTIYSFEKRKGYSQVRCNKNQ
ncbi:MAG: hypothetical protein ABIH63_03855 [archaeon]